MNAIDEITELLRKARVAGGWDDEAVARVVLIRLGLGDDGTPAGDRSGPRDVAMAKAMLRLCGLPEEPPATANPDAPDQSGEPDDRVSDGWVNANSVRS